MENGFSLRDVEDNLNLTLHILHADIAKDFMRNISVVEPVEKIYYVEVEERLLWYAKIFLDLKRKHNVNFKYMIKVAGENVSYFYKGIRAHSTMLVDRCGGWYRSSDRSEWSCSSTEKDPFEVLKKHVLDGKNV